jgi:hypothetical protein
MTKFLMAVVAFLIVQVAVPALVAETQFAPVGEFFLTKDRVPGNLAAKHCTAVNPSFHMASIWEILTPGTLKYGGGPGLLLGDSGFGPPAETFGWVRTGTDSSNAGSMANCNAWTTTTGIGKTARLDPRYLFGLAIAPWETSVGNCADGFRVWCVSNR